MGHFRMIGALYMLMWPTAPVRAAPVNEIERGHWSTAELFSKWRGNLLVRFYLESESAFFELVRAFSLGGQMTPSQDLIVSRHRQRTNTFAALMSVMQLARLMLRPVLSKAHRTLFLAHLRFLSVACFIIPVCEELRDFLQASDLR